MVTKWSSICATNSICTTRRRFYFSSISSFSSFVAYTIVLTVNNHDHSWMKATFNHYSLLKRIQSLLEIMFWYRFCHSNNVTRLQNRPKPILQTIFNHSIQPFIKKQTEPYLDSGTALKIFFRWGGGRF